MLKVMTIFGTRPEAIKMAPLVKALEAAPDMEPIVTVTAQHRDMLDQVLNLFNITPDYDLNIMSQGQTLYDVTNRALMGLKDVLEEAKPDVVLVHGDTTTTFAGALASFYQEIPVGHVEAGLRTGDIYSPFPEEMNRCLTGRIAELHFAPTENNKNNLLREGINKNIFVTGNTVIDAFQTTVKEDYKFKEKALENVDLKNKKCILMTAHRRENLGQPLENICNAVKRIVEKYEDIEVVYPVHLNPAVQEVAHRVLDGVDRVHLVAPLDVEDMHNIMDRSFLVMTDSGGLQEEAPACGVPVLVLRTETERPEAVQAGTVKVVGVDEEVIFNEAVNLIDNKSEYEKMAHAVNPYGDGHASERIATYIENWFKGE